SDPAKAQERQSKLSPYSKGTYARKFYSHDTRCLIIKLVGGWGHESALRNLDKEFMIVLGLSNMEHTISALRAIRVQKNRMASGYRTLTHPHGRRLPWKLECRRGVVVGKFGRSGAPDYSHFHRSDIAQDQISDIGPKSHNPEPTPETTLISPDDPAINGAIPRSWPAKHRSNHERSPTTSSHPV
ncbi:hypothetical protein N7507_003834, partial [Penicillium longicatenatum]